MNRKKLLSLKATVDARRKDLHSNGDGNQHVAFDRVSPEAFEKIQQKRLELFIKARIAYYPDIETLVVKIPTRPHEKAHRLLDRLLLRKTVDPMNLNDNDLAPTGATTVKVPSGSVIETDSWTNANIRGDQDICPGLVVESGMSESLNQLRCDAKWWMESSARRVNIVLIIWISRALGALHIEKYVPGFSQTRTSHRLARPVAATRTATVVIDCLAEPVAVNWGSSGIGVQWEFWIVCRIHLWREMLSLAWKISRGLETISGLVFDPSSRPLEVQKQSNDIGDLRALERLRVGL